MRKWKNNSAPDSLRLSVTGVASGSKKTIRMLVLFFFFCYLINLCWLIKRRAAIKTTALCFSIPFAFLAEPWLLIVSSFFFAGVATALLTAVICVGRPATVSSIVSLTANSAWREGDVPSLVNNSGLGLWVKAIGMRTTSEETFSLCSNQDFRLYNLFTALYNMRWSLNANWILKSYFPTDLEKSQW